VQGCLEEMLSAELLGQVSGWLWRDCWEWGCLCRWVAGS